MEEDRIREVVEKLLADRRSRPACPTSDELAAYALHQSSPETDDRVEPHLIFCGDCFDLIERVREAEDADQDAQPPAEP